MRGVILLLVVMFAQSVFAGGRGSGIKGHTTSHESSGKGSGIYGSSVSHSSPALDQSNYSATPICSTGKLCGNACIPIDHQCGESRAVPPKSISSNGSSVSAAAPNAPIQKPQTYLYEWYNTKGIKVWSGTPPLVGVYLSNYANDYPKFVCVYQEATQLGCYDYRIESNRAGLADMDREYKRLAGEYETYKRKEAAEKEEKEHKELLASEGGEMRDVREKSKARAIQRIGMGTAQAVADRIVEITELSSRAQKYLSSGLLHAALITVAQMNTVSMGITSPKSQIEKLLSSSDPSEKALGERAQVAVGEMGVSLFTGNDIDVTKGILGYITQYISAIELAKKSKLPTTP